MITEIMESPYQQRVWELKEWISRGILFNECPSFAENLTIFRGGPWDGRKAILPKDSYEWRVEEEANPLVDAKHDHHIATPHYPRQHIYYKRGDVMVHNGTILGNIGEQ